MSKIDEKYHNLLQHILAKGFRYEDSNRKGVHRLQIPSYQFKHDFKDGFPAITTKKLYWKGVAGELLTFLRGSTDLKDLHANSVSFWDKDAYNYYLKRNPKGTLETFKEGINIRNHIAGDLGKIYPYQMRSFGEHNIDQISDLINTLKVNPLATKKTVTMWNPSDSNKQCLTPCHWSFEILVEPRNHKELKEELSNLGAVYSLDMNNSQFEAFCFKRWKLSKYKFTLKWHQHSCDTFLGIPMNIAYYALLAQIIGKMTNMIPKGIIGDLSNVHIYEPHLEAVKEQLGKDVDKYDECKLIIDSAQSFKDNDIDNILKNLMIGDFELDDYKSYPSIKAEMLAYNK